MPYTENIRILIADDHAIVREGLRTLIAAKPGLELVPDTVRLPAGVSASPTVKETLFGVSSFVL